MTSAILSFNFVKDLDNGQCVTGLFYLSKAFDIVNQELLLGEMKAMGIHGGCT